MRLEHIPSNTERWGGHFVFHWIKTSLLAEKINKTKINFLSHSLLWVAGHRATTKAISALPQLSTQHCAGCSALAGVTQGKGCKPISSCPRICITRSWYRCRVQLHVSYVPCWNSIKFHRKKGYKLWERNRLCGWVLPHWRPLGLSGKEVAPGAEGKQSHFTAFPSQMIAKRQGYLGMRMNNCSGFWSSYTSLVLLPSLVVSLREWTHHTLFKENAEWVCGE